MKTVFKTIIIFAMILVHGLACASMSRPSDVDDTIPAVPRCPDYYYTRWIDECPNYYPDGIVNDCEVKLYQFHCFFGAGGSFFAKCEHTNQPIKIKGLVAMLKNYNPPTVDTGWVRKLPEYLYLYQCIEHGYYLHHPNHGVELQLLDSVRWDTATARVMELRQGFNGEYTQYCYLYEAYFDEPIYVDSDFYIAGSINSNYVGSGLDSMIHSVYVDIMDFGGTYVDPDPKCDEYRDHGQSLGLCRPEGYSVAFVDQWRQPRGPDWTLPALGWYSPYPEVPFGYFLAIVDQWNLDAVPDTAEHGSVIGGGRWVDDTYDTIEAIPASGYLFDVWSDGSTENPRVIHLTSDTSFVAFFSTTERFNLTVSSSDTVMGTVQGSGRYPVGEDVTIAAVASHNYKFSHWNDGETDNPRTVHVVSDTSFVASFVEKDYFTVRTATNNDAWGSVEGGGSYMEGEQATLSVSTEMFCVFDGWSDGNMQQSRIVTVTQDTLFTAIFSYDSSWAVGIDVVGNLVFTVSPNPTTGHLTVELGRPLNYQVAVYDMHGKQLLRHTGDEAVFEIDLGLFPSGQYLLVVSAEGGYGTRRIIKK